MLKIIFALSLITVGMLFMSCEEVIELELETSQERLVIEAQIRWEKGTAGNDQKIMLSKTSPFYDNTLVPASGAEVSITRNDGIAFVFTEEDPGIYETTSFLPEFDTTYQLTVVYNNQTFTSEETFYAAPDIDNITQSTEDGFDDEIPEITIFFTDFENEENFYRFFILETLDDELRDRYSFTYDDEFEDGNQSSFFLEFDDYVPGYVFDITLFGISEQFANYINLISIQGDADIGPFATPPVNVKGNITNTTSEDNYAYGYFTLNEFVTTEYIFQ